MLSLCRHGIPCTGQVHRGHGATASRYQTCPTHVSPLSKEQKACHTPDRPSMGWPALAIRGQDSAATGRPCVWCLRICPPLGPQPSGQDLSQTEGAISFRHAMQGRVHAPLCLRAPGVLRLPLVCGRALSTCLCRRTSSPYLLNSHSRVKTRVAEIGGVARKRLSSVQSCLAYFDLSGCDVGCTCNWSYMGRPAWYSRPRTLWWRFACRLASQEYQPLSMPLDLCNILIKIYLEKFMPIGIGFALSCRRDSPEGQKGLTAPNCSYSIA